MLFFSSLLCYICLFYECNAMKIRSLVLKLVLAFLVINVITISIVGTLYYLQSKDALYLRTFTQLQQMKNIKIEQLNNFYDFTIMQLRNIAANYDLINNKEYFLNNSINTNHYFEHFLIFNKNSNNIIFELPRKTNNLLEINISSFKANDGFVELSNYKEHKSIIIAYAAINDSLILISELNNEKINQIASNRYDSDIIDKSIETYIIANDGYLRTKSRFIKNAIMHLKYPNSELQNIFEVKNFFNNTFYDYRGVKICRVAEEIKKFGIKWWLLVEIDEDEVFKPFMQLWANTMLLFSGLSVLIIIISFILAKRITIPIKKLTNASKTMTEGNYPPEIEISTNDELAVLTTAFNSMIEQIKTQEELLALEQKHRISAYYDALDEERKRLSRELHDGLGQEIIALKLKLEAIDTDNPQKYEYMISEVKNSIDEIVQEVRNISNNLMPSVLKEFGIVFALKSLCDNILQYSEINCTFNSNIKSNLLNKKEEIYLYRIAQEAIKNAINHSLAKNINLSITSNNEDIVLSISDDGIGFDTKQKYLGNGLYNISERASLINADCEINSDQEHGTEIIIKLKKEHG